MTQQAGGGRRELVGRHRPDGKQIAHHEGFHEALENALENHDWPPGDHEAQVHFGAIVRVTNPGVIHEYIVRIDPAG